MLEYPIPWRVALIIVTVGIANSCGMVNEQGAGTYGEFCGVGRPDVSAFTNEDEKVFALNHVAPTDYIDCACREHDICYARRGRNDKACDALLDYIIDERALRNWCSSVSFDIQGYFDYVHPHGTWVGSVLSSALYLPIRAALLPVDLIEYSVARSSGEFGALCQYQPDRIDKWMAGWINLQESGASALQNFGKEPERVARRQNEALHGRCAAMTELGRHYEWGTGIAKDRKKAVELYRKAAACGDSSALYMLGHHTLRGELPGGEKKALALFTECAKDGSNPGCDVMANMLVYKKTFVEDKYRLRDDSVNSACRGIGSTGWLRRWTSPGPKIIY